MPEPVNLAKSEGVLTAVKHALGWLVFGNLVGLWLSILLLKPEWQAASWTYGRLVPVHLNSQLYGWTALPLVAWLFAIYEVHLTKCARWAPAAVWAWTAALALGVMHWLRGDTGGKIFLDWKDGGLWGFVAALALLWVVLAVAWWQRVAEWSHVRRWLSSAGLIALAAVPAAIVIAASPATYPPVDRTTGGPTGSSLLGSSLIVVGLMLLLPRVTIRDGKGRAGWKTWTFFGFCWLYFGVAEAIGGTHFDWWQHLSLVLMPPWGLLLVRDWRGFVWPDGARVWKVSMLLWWGLLVTTGYLMYFPVVLDRIKFTQGLVAHSHLAMAGFTTSFSMLLVVVLTGRKVAGGISGGMWNFSVLVMIVMLAWMGWREGAESSWMLGNPYWRVVGMAVRSLCGIVMLGTSLMWIKNWKSI